MIIIEDKNLISNKMHSENLEKLNTYSKEKACEVFESLPYTVTDDRTYNEFICKRKETNKKNFRTKTYMFIIKTAAVLFIPLSIYCLYTFMHKPEPQSLQIVSADPYPQLENNYIEYIINSGVKGHVILPDSSEVWINSNSILKCPNRFDSSARHLELSGEAYFKVKSNKNWPMYVTTPQNITAKILGTEFNFCAYDNDDKVKFTLVTGTAELIKKDNSKIDMKPHEQIIVYKNDRTSNNKKNLIDTENDTAWKNGYLVFNNTPMPEVIKRMERWYGVIIKISDPDIVKSHFTARFESESITQVLDLLKISSDIQYRIDQNIVVLYSK